MIRYNATYARWVTDDGKVYRKNKAGDMVLCKQSKLSNGYLTITVSKPIRKHIKVHRLVYETYNGTIPPGMVIDHEDTHKDNNKLTNLKCCTQKDNNNNPITKERRSKTKRLRGVSDKNKKKLSELYKGKHWRIVNGKREWY